MGVANKATPYSAKVTGLKKPQNVQGGEIETPKAGCHVIDRRANGQTSESIVMIYCSKVYDHYFF